MHFLFIALIFISLSVCRSYNSSELMKNYPKPYSPNNKVMGLILAYNLGHFDPILMILNEYVSMCEGGWNTTLVMFTGMSWSDTLLRYSRQRSYCYRISQPIEIRISTHDGSIGVALGAQHRKYMQNEVQNYDVFVYHEDDIVFKHSHLMAYLYETAKLHSLNPLTGLHDNTIGFQRYRRLGFSAGQSEKEVFEEELMEEVPQFKPICIEEQPYLVVHGNIHQAMWIFTKQQVLMLEEKCAFLEQNNPSREYMSSFSIFDHKSGQCGLTKLIPGDRFVTFQVLHYYQQRHVSWVPVFNADENIRAGYHYSSDPRSEMDVPSCWGDIVRKARADQNKTAPA